MLNRESMSARCGDIALSIRETERRHVHGLGVAQLILMADEFNLVVADRRASDGDRPASRAGTRVGSVRRVGSRRNCTASLSLNPRRRGWPGPPISWRDVHLDLCSVWCTPPVDNDPH